MASSKPIILYTSSRGLNTVLDPQRLLHGTREDPGEVEFSQAVNISIDDRGLVSLRNGDVVAQAGEFHSVFCDGGDCFVIQERTSDAALMKINADFSLTGVRSGLIKGARTSFCQVGAKTFYANGVQNGVVTDGVSAAWPDESRHVGADTVRSFQPAQVGQHIAYHRNRMWISVGPVIWITEPYTAGKVDAVRGFIQMQSDINMLKPVKGGMWVSTRSNGTGFISTNEGPSLSEMRWVQKSPYSAHEWSACIELVDLGKTVLQAPGLSAIWSSNSGLCAGTDSGEFISITEQKLVYPKGSTGASVAVERNVINTVF